KGGFEARHVQGSRVSRNPLSMKARTFWRASLRLYTKQMQSSLKSAHTNAAMHGTTVLCVRKDNKVVLIADGQVTMGDHVMKHSAKKTRRLYQDRVVAGFA